MTATVTIGPGTVIAEGNQNGTPSYEWSVQATVNGSEGVFTFWYPASAPYTEVAEYAQVWLEENPGDLGGIASTGPGQDGSDGPSEDGDDDDGELADGGDGDGGEDGDSV
jgi:hypothetical protein